MSDNNTQRGNTLDIVVKRIIDAPVELVWKAWTVTESGWTPSQMYVFSLAGLHQTVDKLIDSLAGA